MSIRVYIVEVLKNSSSLWYTKLQNCPANPEKNLNFMERFSTSSTTRGMKYTLDIFLEGFEKMKSDSPSII